MSLIFILVFSLNDIVVLQPRFLFIYMSMAQNQILQLKNYIHITRKEYTYMYVQNINDNLF